MWHGCQDRLWPCAGHAYSRLGFDAGSCRSNYTYCPMVGACQSSREKAFLFFKDELHDAVWIGRLEGTCGKILRVPDEPQRRMSKSWFGCHAPPTDDLLVFIRQDRLAHEEDRQRT